ncbi:TonB-dependent receptor plug domain-containing protein, partial [Piscinibacter sp.]|uniref:TonB-dependent receptor plug domain-containing protein n=1 Tax=Piscinibacter sp. TaxID=1903157 RepID=UPI002F41BC81
MRLTALCAAFTLVGGCGSAWSAELSEEEELALGFGEKSVVSIATGTQLPVSRAPSVATVITAEDIKALGATDLDEVLETVPGLHVSRSSIAYSPIYTIRGVRGTLTNPQVLMLVNGVPVTSVYIGDRGIQWSGLPLENIARIEVIRG